MCGVLALGCASSEDLGTSHAPIFRGAADEQVRGVVAVANLQSGSLCSGVLIAPRVVLTARHCVARIEDGAAIDCRRTRFGDVTAPDQIVIGTTTAGAIPDRRHGVVSVLVPDEDGFCGGDLAALVLPKPLEDSEPIALRKTGVSPGETFSAVGFGRDGGAPSGARKRRDGLRVACVGERCRSSLVARTEWWGDGAVCEGDSGGPALDAEGRVIGIASRKRDGCSATIYGDVTASSSFVVAALEVAAQTPESRDAAACSHGRGRSGAWPLALLVIALYARGRSRPITAPPPSRLRA